MNTPAHPSATVPNLGENLKSAWNLYKERLDVLIVTQLVFQLAAGLAMGLAAIVLGTATYLIYRGAGLNAAIMFGSLGAALFLMIGTLVSSVAKSAMAFSTLGKKPTYGEAISAGLKNFWNAGWIIFLVQLVVFGGLGLFVIPGIFLGVCFAFVLQVYFAEGVKGFGALMRSKDLVRPHWWSVFGQMLLVGVAFALVSSLLQGVLGGGSSHNPNAPFMAAAASMLFGLFAGPFVPCFMTVLYKGLVAKEGVKPPVVEGRRWKYALVAVSGILFSALVLGSTIYGILKVALAP